MTEVSLLKYDLIGASNDYFNIELLTQEWSHFLSHSQKLEVSHQLLLRSCPNRGAQWQCILDDILFSKWELRNSGYLVATLFVPLLKFINIKQNTIFHNWNKLSENKTAVAATLDNIIHDYERGEFSVPRIRYVFEDFSDIAWDENISESNYMDPDIRNFIAYDPDMPEGRRFSIRSTE